jgi:alkanesulfonate monooxygenase SsuD/methylene tetrahydromethanopterin reductase-like flavin-dependent oxidoreductase (luciferase family)
MVDNISGGRLDLGVGRGYQPGEFKMLGLQDIQADSRQVFKEYLEAMIGLWTNERFSYHGKYVNFDDVDVRPKPVQQPHPPIFVAAISPETFSLVAEQGYNMLVTPTLMVLPELVEFVVDAKRKLVEHGRDPLSLNFPMNWQIHVAESEQKALENTEEAFTWYFNEVMKVVPKGPNVPTSYERYAELADAAEAAGGLTLDGLRQGGIVLLGDPSTAIEEIEKLRDTMGLQQLCCWMRMGGLEHEKVMSSIELFAKEVIPAFANRPDVVPRALREAVPA